MDILLLVVYLIKIHPCNLHHHRQTVGGLENRSLLWCFHCIKYIIFCKSSYYDRKSITQLYSIMAILHLCELSPMKKLIKTKTNHEDFTTKLRMLVVHCSTLHSHSRKCGRKKGGKDMFKTSTTQGTDSLKWCQMKTKKFAPSISNWYSNFDIGTF